MRRARRDPSTLSEDAHGKASTYRNWKCRCEPCTKAHAEYSAPYTRAYHSRKKGQEVPEDKHGTMTGYNVYACRCQPCKDANAAHSRKYRRT